MPADLKKEINRIEGEDRNAVNKISFDVILVGLIKRYDNLSYISNENLN